MNIKAFSLRAVCAAVAAATFIASVPVFALAAENETQITLSENKSEKLTIASGQTATLDLAGFTLTSDAKDACVIENNGTLLIKDSSDEESGKIEKTNTTSDAACIVNNGTLSIQSGNIEAITSNDNISYGIDNRGELTVSGGSISAKTTGTKWAIGVYNTGTIKDISSGAIKGTIDNSSNANNALGISNEANGKIALISGGSVEAFTNTSGVAYGVRNRGEVSEISGGYIHGYSNGSGWTFAFYNTDSGVVNSVSGGKFYGEFANPASGNNGLGISNEGLIKSISGGLFTASVLGSGNSYGIRSDKEITEISGGAFGGSSSSNTIYKRAGTVKYKSGSTLSLFSSSKMRYLLNKGERYADLCNERGSFVGAFIFNSDNTLVSSFELDPNTKYTVYKKSGGKFSALEYSLSDFAAIGENATLYMQTVTDQPIMYFLGSSVTYGHTTGGVSFVEDLEKGNGWVCEKRAVSGTTLVLGTNSYISRMKSQIGKNAKIDCFTCQLSTNDASQNKPLGSVSSSYNLNDFKQTTIIGAMEYIICYAKQNWNCPIVFYTNPKYTSSAYVNMINALYKLKDKWGIEVIDFYNYKNMPAISASELSSMMSDAIHPNEKGYQWMADTMTAFYEDILAKGTETADFTKLNELIKKAEAIDTSVYTQDSVNALLQALESAKQTAADDNSMQVFINASESALQKAIDALVKIPEPTPPTPTPNPTPTPTPTPSVPKNGTKVVNGKTVLYKNSKAVTGTKVVTVGGKTYAVVKGYVKTGKGNRLVNIGKKTYIVNKNGIVQKGAKNKLVKVGKKSYVVNKQGVVQKNKKSIKVGKKVYKTNKKGVATAIKKK